MNKLIHSFKIRSIVYLSILILICSSTVTIPTYKSDELLINQSLEINLDFNNINGKIKQFNEINSGPLPIYNVQHADDITESYKKAGISFIRTHDFYGPTDISQIFPDWNADPNDQNSYNFTLSDYFITGIINADCEVFYRLGESASGNKSLRQPPIDFEKWANICKHIIMHYNDGWNNGYYYNIKYWEIWNEPDLIGFWNSTAEEYYRLYETTVKNLKAYDSSLKIGGPCTSSVYNENFTTKFLDYVIENDLPLDFYSWHMYADTPNQLYIGSEYVQMILDNYGLYSCENINTEWNINILYPQRDKDNSKNAAFTACSFTVFQDTGIDYVFRYRGTQDDNWLARFIGFDLSLFTVNGTFKTPALPYLAMNYIVKDTPLRIQTPEMTAENVLTYLVGISEDKSNISILISNFEASDTDYTINYINLPYNNYTIAHYLIDDKNHLEIINQKTTSDNFYSENIEKSTVHFIRITNSTTLPEEGPSVAKIPLILRLPLFDKIAQLIGILLILLIFS
jgi:hypothetical protein